MLVDPAADRLELVGGLARRIFAKQGHPGTDRHRPPTWTRASTGADAVLLQLRVGGQAARNQDETWPLECGCVGQETTGAGGLAKALRTVPVVLDIAERVRRGQPGRLDHRLHQPGRHRHPGAAAGRAQGRRPVQRGHRLPAQVRRSCSGSRPAEVHLDHVGLNHLTWERAVRLGGPDGRGRAAQAAGRARRRRSPTTCGCRAPLLDRLGVVPSYYLRYYYAHDEVVRELRTQAVAGGRGRGDGEAAAGDVRRPGAGREAGAAGQARRRLLLGGGGGPGRVAAARARGEPYQVVNTLQQRHAALPRRTTR